MKIDFSTEEIIVMTLMIRIHLDHLPESRKAAELIHHLLHKLQSSQHASFNKNPFRYIN